MVVNGLNLTENNKTLFINDTYDIETNLISDKEDKSITYISSNPEVASVDEQGRVSAKTRGETTITVKNEAGGYVETLLITVNKKLSISSTLKQYELDEKFLSDIEKAPGTDRQYLGQPDMVRTSTGRLISAYPVGHGHGPIVMQISDNDGKTWTEKKDIPASWEYCQETPTLYVLNLADGTERIMLISACPPWDLNKGGWETSYSDDNGNTWTEYQHFHANLPDGTKNSSVVGMASLVQLKDESGNFIQKWMGVYHTMNYVNYKTYLTFDDNGNEVWSVPEAYLSEYRDIEKQYQICEVGMFRSPDGKRIVGLARSQSHNNPATLIYSDDEGKTWSKPMDLPGSLAGERHKVVYDPISNRLVVTFREIKHDLNGNNQFDGNTDWTCGEWIAWVGTYEDLMEQNDGEYTFIIANDYSNNAKSGDTGYAGVVVLEDGTFIMNSYGHWDKEFSQSWPNGVTSDLCYIKQAKFKLGDIENANHLVSRKQLNTLIEEVKNIDATMYTKDSFAVFSDALTKAMKISEDNISQQVEVNAIETVLSKAYKQLVREHKIEVDVKDNAPSISIGSSIEEIKKAILSESEANKDVAFDVKLHVEEIKNVTNEISSEITAKLGSDEKIGSYLNLELFKVINGTSIQLSNLNSKIRMTIAIPTHLLGKEKYSILRYHEGKVEQFNDLDNDPKTITFETDRFSIFALTYTEKTEEEIKPTPVIKPDDSTPVINPDKTTPVVNPEKPSKDVMNQVNTGDTSNKNALLVMMLVAGIAIIIVSKKRKKV
ncbi:MAG: LPXTG cell wall anchor domain-containing protein [Erysipelotrichia bacterium]|nr:LPXTG cell wall anchor domain-containing protein [Erysipelotrichia bacterium]